MARPRTFDPDDVLDKALLTFWARGWEATSIGDLCHATGVNRYSLYQTWGDKRGLFEACIDRYVDRMAAPALEQLGASGEGLQSIRAYFHHMVDAMVTDGGALSCFVLTSLMELGPHDAALFARLRGHLDRVRDAFLHVLQRAVERGELPASHDLEQHADHLAISIQAVMLQGRTQPGRPALDAFVHLTLATLETP